MNKSGRWQETAWYVAMLLIIRSFCLAPFRSTTLAGLCCRAQESHRAPLYCASFNYLCQQHSDLFATVGSSRATVYRCLPDGNLQVVQVYRDSNNSEEFYLCRWSHDTRTGASLLVLAGKNALVRVVNCATGMLEVTFEGHGQSINDIAVHPTRPHLVATASKDHSLRLWNIRSRTCVLIFQGDGGHKNEVLSVEWRPGGDLTLVSAGMDNHIKVWDLTSFESNLIESDDWDASLGAAFPIRHVAVPNFSAEGVHWNYVDCIRWLGNYLLSKSVDDKIICWRPEPEMARGPHTLGAGPGSAKQFKGGRTESLGRWWPDGGVHVVGELQLEGTRDYWWMRFSLDPKGRILAQGTIKGHVLLYDLTTFHQNPVARLEPKRLAARPDESRGILVRQTAVSVDGNIVISCHDDGSVTRYDYK